MRIIPQETTQCRKCGTQINFFRREVLNTDGSPHKCKSKVKIYTEKEMREMGHITRLMADEIRTQAAVSRSWKR